MSADRRSARRWWLAALAASAALTAACGTTVPVSQQASASGQAGGQVDAEGLAQTGAAALGSGAGAAPSTPGGDAAAPVVQPGTQPDGAHVEGAARSGRSGTAPSGTTDRSDPRQVPAGPARRAGGGVGVTDTTITIGALTANGAGEYQRAAGFSSGASGDQIAMMRSVVAYLNARGGIDGRKIKLVVYDVPASEAATNPSTAYEAACTALTQDAKVFAIASIVSGVTKNFYECLRKRGIPVVTANPALSSRFFREFAGTLYAPTNPSYTRLLTDSVEALWASGWLKAGSKVGVVGFDTPDARATVADSLVPALKKRGLSLTSDFYTGVDAAGSASAYSGGVLKFKAAGVDRVFFAPGGQPIYFGLAAQQQAYEPFLSLSTLEYPGPIAGALPAAALRGAAGLGWSPYLDLDNASAREVGTPGGAQCVDAVRSADQDLSTGTTLAIATWICDDWFFLRDALADTTSLTAAGFQAGVAGLGSRFRAANTYRTSFAPGRTADGAAAYRLLRFEDPCGCFRYASGERPLP